MRNRWCSFRLKTKYEVPVCECGLHLTSRSRIGMINDKNRQSKYIQALQSLLDENSVALCLSECSFLSHYIASKSLKKVIMQIMKCNLLNLTPKLKHFEFQVYSYETNRIIQDVLCNVAKFNNVYSKICYESSSDGLKKSIQQNNDTVS